MISSTTTKKESLKRRSRQGVSILLCFALVLGIIPSDTINSLFGSVSGTEILANTEIESETVESQISEEMKEFLAQPVEEWKENIQSPAPPTFQYLSDLQVFTKMPNLPVQAGGGGEYLSTNESEIKAFSPVDGAHRSVTLTWEDTLGAWISSQPGEPISSPAGYNVALYVRDIKSKKEYLVRGQNVDTAGTNQFVWTGKDSSGKEVPDGVYEWYLKADAPTITYKISEKETKQLTAPAYQSEYKKIIVDRAKPQVVAVHQLGNGQLAVEVRDELSGIKKFTTNQGSGDREFSSFPLQVALPVRPSNQNTLAFTIVDQAGNQQIEELASLPSRSHVGNKSFFPQATGRVAGNDLVINLLSGNGYQHFTGFSQSGTGLPIDVSLTYNHQNARKGLLGYGWTLAQDSRLTLWPDKNVSWKETDGTEYLFMYQNGVFKTFVDGQEQYYPQLKINDNQQYVLTWSTLKTDLFSNDGRILQHRDRYDNFINYSYERINYYHRVVYRVDKISTTTGKELDFQYDKNGKLLEITGPGLTAQDGRSIKFMYNPSGQLSEFTNVMGHSTHFEYDAQKRLISTKNAKNIVTKWQYDEQNRITNITMKRSSDGVEEFIKASYSLNNATVTTPLGSYVIGWDAVGRPSYKKQEVTTDKGNEEAKTTYHYEKNYLVKETDPLGRTKYSAFDTKDRLIATRGESGRIQRYQYNDLNDIVEETSLYGYKIEYKYTMSGKKIVSEQRIEHVSDPFGRTKPYTITKKKILDSKGLVDYEVDGENRKIDYTYDAHGQMLSDGLDTTYTYDPMGNMITKTTYKGTADESTTKYRYNKWGQAIYTEHPNGLIEEWTYDALGQTTKSVKYSKESPDLRKETVTFEYNEGQHLTKESSETLESIYIIDGVGNKVKVTERPTQNDSNSKVYQYTYDNQGRTITEEHPSGLKVKNVYNLAGDRVEISTTPGDNKTIYQYDEFGRLTATINPDGAKEEYLYDAWDRQAVRIEYRSLIIPDKTPLEEGNSREEVLVTEYRYNTNGQIIEEKSPAGSWTRYTYDANGQVATETSGGVIPGVDGTPLQTGDTDSIYTGHEILSTVSYKYDVQGRVIEETDSEGYKTEYEYSGLTTKTKAPAFDENGKLVYHISTTVHNAMGDLVKEISPSGKENTYTYDVFGKEALHVNEDGQKFKSFYDEQERLSYTEEDVTADGKKQKVEYTYDEWGFKSSVKEQLNDSEYALTEYDYNALGQLLKQKDPSGLITTYAYNEFDLITEEVSINQTPQGEEIRKKKNVYDSVGRKIQTVWPDGTSSYLIYDTLGQLAAEIDQLGYVAKYNYTKDGFVSAIQYYGQTKSLQSPILSQSSMKYDGKGNLVVLKDPLGNLEINQYDSEDRLIKKTWEGKRIGGDALSVRYEYDPQGLNIASYDGEGNKDTFFYNQDGQLKKVVDASGVWTTYEYSQTGNVTAIRRPLGRDTLYAYNLKGQKVYEKDALGYQYTFGYDVGGRLLWETNKRGDTISYSYDAAGRMLKKYTPNEGIYRYAYDSIGNQVMEEKPVYGKTYYTYDNRENLITVNEPGENDKRLLTYYTYDVLGNRLSQLDPLGQITRYTYDYANRKTQEVMYLNGMNFTFAFYYDAAGNLIRETKPGGEWVNYSYDLKDRLTNEIFSDGRFVGYTYYNNDLMKSETTKEGSTTYSYYPNGQVQSVTSLNGDTITYEYDASGDLAVEYVNGEPRTYERDETGKTTKYTDAKGFVYHYSFDPDGYIQEVSLPNGVKTAYTYKPSHLIDTKKTVGPNGESIYLNQYKHNKRENVTDADENGRQFHYDYESREQLDKVVTPEGDIRLYSYDAAGNRISRSAIIGGASEDKGVVISLEDLLIKILAASKDKETESTEGNSEESKNEKNQENNGKGKKFSTNSQTTALNKESLANNSLNVLAKNYSNKDQGNKGNNGNNGNNSNNGNSNQGSGKSNEKGNENALERGKGKKLGLYKKLGLTDSLDQKITGQVENILAVLDNIVNGEVNLPPGEHTELFALIREVGKGYTVQGTTWEYNERNEVTYKSNNIRFEEYEFGHDQTGNMTTDGRSIYKWNAKGQLVKVTFPDGFGQAYEYDAKGRRSKVTQFNHQGSSQWIVNYHYQGNSWLITKETDQNGNITKEYTYSENGLPLSITFKGETFWYVYNGHGDVVALTDKNGEVAARYEYDEWGLVTKMYNRFGERVREGIGWIGDLNTGNGTPGSRTGSTDNNDDIDYHPGNGNNKNEKKDNKGNSKNPSLNSTEKETKGTISSEQTTKEEGTEPEENSIDSEEVTADITTDLVKENPYRYSHYYFDRKTQFYYLQARYYNPRLARFISMDPWRGDITNPLSLNRYVYSYNNPVNYIDPTGLMAWHQVDDLLNGIGKMAYDSVVDILLSPKNLWELSKAMVNGELSFKELGKALSKSATEPIAHLINNHNKIWLDKPKKPKDKEVNKYGYHLGEVLTMVVGSSAAIKVITKVAPKVGKNLSKINPPKKDKTPKPNNSNTQKKKSNANKKDSLYKKGCNCFTAGTKVITDEGEKPIEDIEVGDKVLAKSDETGEVAYKEVVGLFQKQSDEIYSIYVGNEVIEATKEHPVWIDGRGWTEVKDLKVGDLLVTSDGLKIAIDKIEKEPRVTTVYNFTVLDYKSYFVSNLGIWVHNCTVITAGKNFKDHFIRHKGILEKALGTKYAKYKTHGQAFLDDIGKIIDNGTVQFVGKGTLKKDGEVLHIYRGNGMTVAVKPNGEFVTLLESGKGMDLNIQFVGK